MRFYGSPRIAYARDGSGNYSIPQAAFVDGTTIAAADINSNFSDVASALTASIAKDGQTPATANLPMGGYRHTGVGNATARTHYASAAQILDNSITYAADTGAADVYAITVAPAITAYVVGQRFTWKVANTNTTTTPTLNVNAIGAGVIKWPNGDALYATDLPANAMVEVVVAATTPVFHLQTISTSTGSAAIVRALNPTLSGTPLVPTATAATNTTQIASTAYVDRVAVQQTVSTLTGAVSTGTTVVPADDTIPQNTEGDEYMTLAVTPKSATSKLIINVIVNGSATVGGIACALFQDSTADALSVASVTIPASGNVGQMQLTHVMTSGTTSATTFKVRAGPTSAGTFTFNGTAGGRLFGGKYNSSIVITEIGI